VRAPVQATPAYVTFTLGAGGSGWNLSTPSCSTPAYFLALSFSGADTVGASVYPAGTDVWTLSGVGAFGTGASLASWSATPEALAPPFLPALEARVCGGGVCVCGGGGGCG
jgi:hypothetical protein